MPVQLTKEFQHGTGQNALTVQITVRSAAGWDKYQEQVLFHHMWRMMNGRDYAVEDYGSVESRALNDFVEVVNRTVSITGLPIVWPTPKSSDKDLCAGFDYLKEIPLAIYNGWLILIDDVEQAPGDPDLAPPENLSEEQKKDPK